MYGQGSLPQGAQMWADAWERHPWGSGDVPGPGNAPWDRFAGAKGDWPAATRSNSMLVRDSTSTSEWLLNLTQHLVSPVVLTTMGGTGAVAAYRRATWTRSRAAPTSERRGRQPASGRWPSRSTARMCPAAIKRPWISLKPVWCSCCCSWCLPSAGAPQAVNRRRMDAVDLCAPLNGSVSPIRVTAASAAADQSRGQAASSMMRR